MLQRDVIARSNVLKARAIQERKTTDRYDAVRNRDTRKTLATPKRISADRRDDLSVIDRRDFDINVGASSDSGNRTGSVSVGHELQTFRAFVQGSSGGEDSGGFHGINPFFPWRSSLGVMPYALGVTISAGTVLCVSHPGLEPAMAALRWLLTLSGGLCLPVQRGHLEVNFVRPRFRGFGINNDRSIDLDLPWTSAHPKPPRLLQNLSYRHRSTHCRSRYLLERYTLRLLSG